MCSGLCMTSKTRSRGASKSRVMRISRSEGVVTAKVLLLATSAGMAFLLLLDVLEVSVEAVEASFPDDAIAFGPLRDVLERSGLDAAGSPLGVASARDEAGVLEHAEVFRDGGQA